jgi:hypothetical protein
MTPLRFAITSPHQDVKRTSTSKLSFMNGVHAKSPGQRRGFFANNVISLPT